MSISPPKEPRDLSKMFVRVSVSLTWCQLEKYILISISWSNRKSKYLLSSSPLCDAVACYIFHVISPNLSPCRSMLYFASQRILRVAFLPSSAVSFLRQELATAIVLVCYHGLLYALSVFCLLGEDRGSKAPVYPPGFSELEQLSEPLSWVSSRVALGRESVCHLLYAPFLFH